MNNPFDELQAQLNHIEGMLQQLLDRQHNVETSKNERPIGIEEAAKLLGLSVNTIYKNRFIPRHKRHNKLRFFESELFIYIKNQPKPQQELSFTPATLRRKRSSK